VRGRSFEPHAATFHAERAKPVIAALKRPVSGIGLDAGADVRVRLVAENAKLTTRSLRGVFARRHLVDHEAPVAPRGRSDLCISGSVVLGSEAAEIGTGQPRHSGEPVSGGARLATSSRRNAPPAEHGDDEAQV